jgi:geranylgeranyl pyrophosphate synthase
MLQDLRLNVLHIEHVALCRLAVFVPIPHLAALVHDDLDHASSYVRPAITMTINAQIAPNRTAWWTT